jgi:membrane protease YdiL (CAAX protease family)
MMETTMEGRSASALRERSRGRVEQRLELLVFLLLIVPSMAFSFFAIKQGSVSFTLTAVATIFRDIGLVALILFFLWHNAEHVRQIGWHFPHLWRDIVIGALLFVPMFYGADLLEQFLQSIGFSVPSTPLPTTPQATGLGETLLALLLVLVVAISEETIFRGYLIDRLQAFVPSQALAVIGSAIIFMLGHGYEGSAGVLTVGAMGVVFGLVYLWRKSLVAPITMHLLQDLVVIVIIPLLTGS